MKLHFRTADLRLNHTWTIARASADVFQVVIVELTDTDGTLGLGEASPVARYNESSKTVAAFLSHVDAAMLSFDNVPSSMRYIESLPPGNNSARCALNVALLDGAAKRARKPLHDHLGLGFRERHHVTSFSIGIAAPDIIRRKTLAAEQFPILKLKVGSADDDANFAALRQAAPAKTVRVDANEGWTTKEQALRMIEQFAADGHVELIEQPMPATTPVEDMIWLKERSPLQLFADESYHTATDAALCSKCFHGVNVKLGKAGGVSGAFDALLAARNAGLKTMLGCMIETSILISAAAHLAELCDHLDLDGNLLIANDPFIGVRAREGTLSFSGAAQPFGLRASPR
ncbi:MAG TPA: dipeptide epimerase [Verrucomicrobiota bacterium]|nr:dipeptide epimerase [Verrucomicrobiota bacterium]